MSYQATEIFLKTPIKTVGNYEWNQEDSSFEQKKSEVSADSLVDGQILVKLLYLSNDPTQRVWVQDGINPKRMYTPPVYKGETMRSLGLGEVVASKSEKFSVGDKVNGLLEWKTYSIISEARIFNKIDESQGLPLPFYLSAVGMTALTAYFGLKEVCQFKEGQSVVVSAASGATGSMVVQIAKHIFGASKVVGITSSTEKGEWIKSIGADHYVNYKDADFKEQLEKIAGEDYFDAYFDNVGGEILNSVLPSIKRFGHVAACGAISSYNDRSQNVINNWGEIITNRLNVRGFIVGDFAAQFPDAIKDIVTGIKTGKIKANEGANIQDVSQDENPLDRVPAIWSTLFTNKANGKLITKIA